MTAIYHTTANGTVPFAYPVSGNQFITNTSECIGYLYSPDDTRSAYVWQPGGTLQFLVDVWGIYDVNNAGDFGGVELISETTKRGTTDFHDWNCLFDGTLTKISEQLSGGPYLEGINDYNDLLFQTRIDGKRNEPPYYSGSIYFADLDREVAIDKMIDTQNTDEDLALWFGSNEKWFVDVTNSRVVVGYIPASSSGFSFATTFLLIPVEP